MTFKTSNLIHVILNAVRIKIAHDGAFKYVSMTGHTYC